MTTINRHIQFNRGELNEYRIASSLPKSGEPICHPFNKTRFHEIDDKQVVTSSMISRLGTGNDRVTSLNYGITNQIFQVYKIRISSLPITTSWVNHSITSGGVAIFAENGRWTSLTSSMVLSWNTYSIDTSIDIDYENSDIYNNAHLNPMVINADYPNQDLEIVGILNNNRELQLRLKGGSARTASDVYVNIFVYQPFIEVQLPQPITVPTITFTGTQYWIGFGDSSLGQLGLQTYGKDYYDPQALYYHNNQNILTRIIGDVDFVEPAIGKNHIILPTTNTLTDSHDPSAFYRAGSSKYGQITQLPNNENKTSDYIDLTLNQTKYVNRISNDDYVIADAASNSGIIKLLSNNKSSAFITKRTDPIQTSKSIKSLYSFGENSYAQLGLADTIDRDQPTLVPTFFDPEDPSENPTLGSGVAQSGYLNVDDAAIGHMHGLLLGNGKVYSWGNNVYGQCGLPTQDYYTVTEPRFIASGTGTVNNVYAGGFHSLYVTNNNTDLFSFGKNEFGQLGLRHKNNVSNPEPVLLTEPNAVTLPPFPAQITVEFTSTETENGTVEQIGFNESTSRKYLLGREDGSRVAQKYRFIDVPSSHALAFVGIDQSKVTGQQTLTCREINGVPYNFYYGWIEIEADISAPITVMTCDEDINIGGYEILAPYFDNDYEIVDVKCGLNHTVIMVQDNQLNKKIVFTCGNNKYGQLATGDNVDRSYMYKLPGFWRSIAAGDNHTVLVSEDYAVYVAGDNSNGQLGQSDTNISSLNTLTLVSLDLSTAGTSLAYAGGNSTLLLPNPSL